MTLVEIIFGTPLYHESYLLRDRYLRKPLGLEFLAKDIEKEYREKHWGLLNDQYELVASLVYRFVEDKRWKMRQVVVDEAYRGQGLGRILVEQSEASMSYEYGMNQVELSARSTVVQFYENLSYEKEGKEFLEIGIPHQKMTKAWIRD